MNEDRKVIQFPKTAAGRLAMRDALFILRNVGPPPDGSHVCDVDWDQFVIECELAELARLGAGK